MDLIEEIAELARRLARHDLVVAALEVNWGSFGSWSVEVQSGKVADAYSEALRRGQYSTQGPQVFRFNWDGKDQVLLVDTAPKEPMTSPGPWQAVLDRRFADTPSAIQFVEAFVLERVQNAG